MTRYEQALFDMTERHERERKNLIAAREEIERYEALAAECSALVTVTHSADQRGILLILHSKDWLDHAFTGRVGELLPHAKLANASGDNPLFAVEIDGHVFNVWWEG